MFDDDVWQYMPLGAVPTLVIGAIGLLLLAWVTVVSSRSTRILARAMLGGVVLGVLTYTARGVPSQLHGEFAWKVGASIRTEWGSVNQALGLVNIFGNVLMFVPLGWLVAVLFPRRRLVAGTLVGLVFSILIEVGQMASGSTGDIDDVLLNTMGAFIGAAVVAMVVGIRQSAPRERLQEPASSATS